MLVNLIGRSEWQSGQKEDDMAGPTPEPTPYTIVVDTREGRPYSFARLFTVSPGSAGDARGVVVTTSRRRGTFLRHRRPIDRFTFAKELSSLGKKYIVQTTVRGLATGDYSLFGFEDQVAIERKSLADLFGTLGQGRKRFERELTRLAAMKFAAVVVEAEWSAVLGDPPRRSKLNPKTVFHSVVAWQQRFPRVHWWFLPGRDAAEAAVVRILDRFWREASIASIA